MPASDSEEELHGPPPPKRRKYRHKNLATRIKEVDVDVFRQLHNVRSEPIAGSDSFFWEELQKWRELNAAEHFIQAAGALHGLCQTFPLLLHHKDKVFEILLENVKMEAALSLEPIFVLLGTLARDLQSDFLPYLERVLKQYSTLVDQGAEREPELLESMFKSLALMMQHLTKLITSQLPQFLRHSSHLRHHEAPHVRRLAAATFSYLVRHATTLQMRAAVRTLFAEHANSPTEVRSDGAGLFLTECCKGISHGLHSKAPQILQLALDPDLLSSAKLSSQKGGKLLDAGHLQECSHMVIQRLLAHLLEHMRRGKLQPLWTLLLANAAHDLEAFEAKPSNGTEARIARSVACLSTATEFFRGSRVEDYQQLLQLSTRLCRADILSKCTASTEQPSTMLDAALHEQTLRFLTAVLAGHGQKVGASEGLGAVQPYAPQWQPVFEVVDGVTLLPFLHSLLTPPSGGRDVAALFFPQIIHAIARLWLHKEAGPAAADEALLILADLCAQVHPQNGRLVGARPEGKELAARLLRLVLEWKPQVKLVPPEELATDCGRALCALQCLPFTCSDPNQMIEAHEAVIASAKTGLESVSSHQRTLLLALISKAAALKADALHGQLGGDSISEALQRLSSLAAEMTQLTLDNGTDYNVVAATDQVLGLCPESRALEDLERLLPKVVSNLSSRSQAMRRATLGLLTRFHQPAATHISANEVGGPSTVLHALQGLEAQHAALSNSKSAPAAIEQLQTAFEFKKIPTLLVDPVVRSLLGLLNIRLSYIWPATANALGCALNNEPSITWPLVLDQLCAIQQSFLTNTGPAISQVPSDCLPVPRSLRQRMQNCLMRGSPEHNGGATDASIRLRHLLKALGLASPELLVKYSQEWVPLLAAYTAAKIATLEDEGSGEAHSDGDDPGNQMSSRKSDSVSLVSVIGGRVWRAHLKDWLAVLATVKAPKNLHNAQRVLMSTASLLTDLDPGVQQAALKCLKAWKLKFLEQHLESLSRLADESTLRMELTSFPLATDSDNSIASKHRSELIGVVARVLWPKMRRRSGRLGGKGAPGSARSAILNFLAAAEPLELTPLLMLFLQPLQACFVSPETVPDLTSEPGAWRLFQEQWWERHLGSEAITWWLKIMDSKAVAGLPLRVKLGFLNAAGDLLQHLGHRLEPFLPEICSMNLSFLEWATFGKEDKSSMEGAREIRSLSLRLFAALFQHFPESIDLNPLWPRLLTSIQAVVDRLPIEVSAERTPPVLELVAALSKSVNLLPLLADKETSLDTQEEQLVDALNNAADLPGDIPGGLGSRLLQQAFTALGEQHCSPPARDACLGILEAILGYGNSAADILLRPHLDLILRALQSIAVPGSIRKQVKAITRAKKGEQGTKKHTILRALTIMEQLSVLNVSPDLLHKMVGALLPMLLEGASKRKKGAADEASTIRILSVLNALWSRQGQMDAMQGATPDGKGSPTGEVAASLAPLAGSLEDRQAGLALSAAVTSLAVLDSGLADVAKTLEGLVAVSTDAIEGLDYDARLAAYRRLDTTMWTAMASKGGAALILHRCFLDLRNPDDLALRHAAAQALQRCVQAVSHSAPAEGGACWDLVLRVVFPLAKKAINASNLAVRQEHLELVRSLCTTFPDKFQELHSLSSKDVETDFFANIAHLQVHRRTRALQRLAKVLKEGRLGPGVLLGVAMPLISQLIVEGRGGEAMGHELKEADKDRQANVVDAAITTLGEMAGHMQWTHYQQLLGHFLKAMQPQSETKKAVIRAVCTIIDAFHFTSELQQASLPQHQQEGTTDNMGLDSTKDLGAHEGNVVDDDPAHDDTARGCVGPAIDAGSGRDITVTLTKRVLPVLQAAMVVKSGETVRPAVALALVKLLRLLPPEATRTALPRALQGVANLLRNRLQRIRDDARNVMSAMVAALGQKYLGFALDVLESALPDRGYMGHIKGYTLHYLLEGLSKDLEPGGLDAYIARILPMIDSQLFGGVSEEKEAGAFAGTREAKKIRAYDTFQLLAQGITFKLQLASLLSLVRGRLGQAGNPAARQKLSHLLDAAQKGVALNPTAIPADLLVFVSGVLETIVPAEVAAARKAEAAAQAASTGDGQEVDSSQPEASRHQHLFLEFALTLLQRGLKKGTLGGSSPQMLAMLDPLLPHLVTCLTSRHSSIVELSLRIFSRLVQLPLQGLATAAPSAAEAMTNLLQNSNSTNSPIAQECLRLLAAFLRTCPEWAPTTPQLRFLISWALTDIEEAAAQVAAFALLRGVIKRRLVVPEVYDVMGKVEDLMVRAQASSVRQLCSSTLLQFLLDYPVGEKRFQQHVHKLVANLSYEHESGRLAAIDMLSVLVTKLPQDLLVTYAPILFMPLVSRLVNDPSADCRKEIGAALAALLKTCRADEIALLSGFCTKWLTGADARLRRAAVQALGFFAELEASSFGRRIRLYISALTGILAAHAKDVSAVDSIEQEESEQGPATPQAWQEVYYTLHLLLKMMRHCPRELRWSVGRQPQLLWETVPQLLLHRHLWVRKLAADLLGMGLADPGVWKDFLAEEPEIPAQLASLLYQQLEEVQAKQEDLLQTSKCLIFLLPHLFELDRAQERLPSQHLVSSAASVEEGAGAGADDGETDPISNRLSLYGLIRRIARLADDRTFPRRIARLTGLRFMAAIATRLGPERVGTFLPIMLRPLFRITEGLSPNPQEVVDLAQEVVAHLRQVAGTDALLTAFNEARQAVQSSRDARRRQQAVQVLLDPQAAAKSKLQKQARRAKGRKRKMEELARMRSAGAPVKNKKVRRKAVE